MQRKILTGSATSFIRFMIAIVVNLLQTRLALEFFTKDIAGLWFVFINFSVLLTLFDFGISPTLSREMAFLRGKYNVQQSEYWQANAQYYALCRRIFFYIAILVFAVSAFLGVVYLQNLQANINFMQVYECFLVFSIAIALQIYNNSCYAIIYGLGNVAVEQIARTIPLILGLAFIILLSRYGLLGFCVAYLLRGLLTQIIVSIYLKVHYPGLKDRFFDKVLLKKIITPAMKWGLSSIGAMLLLQTNNIIISLVLGADQVPTYAVLVQVVETIIALSILVSRSMVPTIAEHYAANRLHLTKYLATISIRVCVISVVSITFIFSLCYPQVFHLWLGKRFVVNQQVLFILLLVAIVDVHHIAYAQVAQACNFLDFVLIYFVAGILNVILSSVFALYFGLVGVAVASLIVQLSTNFWFSIRKLIQHLNIKQHFYYQRLVKPTLAFFLLIALLAVTSYRVNLFSLMLGQQVLLSIIIKLLVASMICIMLAYCFMCSKQEKKRFLSILRR